MGHGQYENVITAVVPEAVDKPKKSMCEHRSFSLQENKRQNSACVKR